jgi:opacity protein-like surface antigen
MPRYKSYNTYRFDKNHPPFLRKNPGNSSLKKVLTMKKFAIASAIAVAAISAQAQQTYAEIGYTAVSYEEQVAGYTAKSSPKALRGIFGYELNENLAIEGLLGFGMSDGNVKVSGQTIPGAKLKVDNLFGIYVTPKTKLAENLEGFVRAGFARAKGTVSLDGESSSDSTSGFSYGLGVRYAIDKKTFVNVDYMSYFNKSDAQATGFTVGLGIKF